MTPLRVAHRRAQLVRERVIHRVEAQQLKNCWYAVTLTTSAGTYVKEVRIFLKKIQIDYLFFF